MSKVFTAKEICEEALGMIGAFPVTESAADGEQLRRAMTWLDLILGETAGTKRIFSLIPDTVPLAITNGTGSYNLNSALGTNLPPDGIQFPVEAYLEDGGGNRSPITIVSRETIDNVQEPARTGTPEMVYIDRLAETPTLRIWPVPAASDPQTWTLKLVVQCYAPNVAPSGITGTQPAGTTLHQFRVAWQRWMIFKLAHDLGSGPIFKLEEQRLRRYEGVAKAAMLDLEAFENREHDTEPPVAEPWGR